jgi:hypothetical protein
MITENQKGQSKRVELFELLEKISKETSRKEKIILVRDFAAQYPSFADYLRCVFDTRVQFLLPEGRPPFDAAEEQSYPSTWHRAHKQLTYFVKGLKADHLQELKRETMFIGILESVHPKDAEVLIDMIAKKSSAKGLTEKVVREAVPNLLPASE